MARTEPINATQTHSKAKVSVYFSDPLFIAGEHVSGKMELECKAERGLGIGDIKVELFAIQELTSRDHSATNTFLHLTRYFQGPGLPPSNAVHPHPLPGDDNVLPVDYYLARKGATTFFFRFPVPASSPASIDFGKGLAKLKYEVRASVGVSWRGERQRILERREVAVVEAPGDASDVERIVVGENGKIWAQGRVLNPYLVAGRDACVELFVKNHANKRTSSLSLSLVRNLHLPNVSQIHKSLQLSDVLANVPFRGAEYIVQPGTEGIANLVFSVPRNAQGVRSGRLETGEEDEGREPVESLFDVQCIIEVKIGMGFGGKDIVLELPVTIYHPAAMRVLPPPRDRTPYAGATPQDYPQPQRLFSPPHQTVSPYQSPPSGPMYDPYPQTTAYISPPMSPPLPPPSHPIWSPPLQAIPPQQAVSPYPQMAHDQYYYYPPPPPINYSPYPARPSSADPFVSRPLPTLPTQNVNHAIGQPAQSQAASPGAVGFINDRPEQGELGKGERASRITAHLRMSSRNRSASPPSHRFPQATLAPTAENVPAQLQVAPPLPMGVEFPRSSPTGSHHEVLSPRPVLTPKQSFSFDRGTVKSEHVIDLERMAAEQEAKKDSNSLEERNKTLPPAPLPAASEPPETPRLPPEPTLQPIPTRLHPDIWSRESGLAALEQKLLEQVGTRKPDSSRRTDVRGVLPDPIKIPPPNDPRCDPPNDSAISSLALGADISLDDVPPPKLDLDISSTLSPTVKQEERTRKEDKSPDKRAVNGRETKKKKNQASHLREAASGRIAAWLGGLDSASPPETQISPFSSPAAPLHDLPSPIDLDLHPLLRSSPKPAPDKGVTRDESRADTVPTRSSGFVLHVTKDTSTFEDPSPKRVDEHDTEATSPNGVASSPDTPIANGLSPVKPVLWRFADVSNKLQPPDHKYDIRSARGGRGGKVTSVAALWTSLASQQEPVSPPIQRAQKAGTSNPAFKDAARTQTKNPPDKKQHQPQRSPPHIKKRREDNTTTAANGMNVADLTTRRARMIKATSVPAVVSSSLATPVLSSTASLARPIEVPYPKRSYPPIHTSPPAIAEQQRQQQPQSEVPTPRAQSTKSPAASDLAFGQARLKDLIKKYQQGFGQ